MHQLIRLTQSNPWGRYYYKFHFADEETDRQKLSLMHMVLARDGARVWTQVSLSPEPLFLASLCSYSGNKFREFFQDYSAGRVLTLGSGYIPWGKSLSLWVGFLKWHLCWALPWVSSGGDQPWVRKTMVERSIRPTGHLGLEPSPLCPGEQPSNMKCGN